MQRQPDGVVEDPAADADLHALGDARGLPAAPGADGHGQGGDDHRGDRDHGEQHPPVGQQLQPRRPRRGSGWPARTLSSTILVP